MAFGAARTKEEVVDQCRQDGGPGHGAGLGWVLGLLNTDQGQASWQQLLSAKGRLLDRLLDIQAGTVRLLRKMLYIIRKLGFKDLVTRKKRCNLEEV